MITSLLPLFPKHDKYVEVFGGGASLLFAKSPVGFEVYNDIDEGLITFFRVLREPALFHRFLHKVRMTPYSRSEYVRALHDWHKLTDPVERAFNWFLVARWSFGGRFGSGFGTVTNDIKSGMASTVSCWVNLIKKLPVLHERIMRVQIECQDWRRIIERYDGPGTFLYVDPPYLQETRKFGGYAHELTREDHDELIERLLEYPRLVMLSGYAHSMHDTLIEHGWWTTSFMASCSAAGRVRHSKLKGVGSANLRQPRVETVWTNYTPEIKT